MYPNQMAEAVAPTCSKCRYLIQSYSALIPKVLPQMQPDQARNHSRHHNTPNKQTQTIAYRRQGTATSKRTATKVAVPPLNKSHSVSFF